MGAGFAIGRSLFGPDGIPIFWLLLGGVSLFAAFKMFQAVRFYRNVQGYYNVAKEAINQPKQIIINVTP
jgi:hypothetical protein